LASASCGGGTEESSSDKPIAGTTGGMGGMAGGGMGGAAGNGPGTCGDRLVDAMANEQCEPMLGVPANLTCESLGMGRGMIMCSSSCRLMMMCAPTQVVGGTTGGMAGSGG
jgi:hypothetical protein